MESVKVKKLHSICIENRNKAVLQGVENVVNSTESIINLLTGQGALSIFGKDLKIEKFNIEDESLVLSGMIDSIKYTVTKPPILKRLFK